MFLFYSLLRFSMSFVISDLIANLEHFLDKQGFYDKKFGLFTFDETVLLKLIYLVHFAIHIKPLLKFICS